MNGKPLHLMTMAELHACGHGCGNCRTPWGVSDLWCRNG